MDYLFQTTLNDPVKSQDIRNNRTMIEKRILANNLIIAIKIFFYTVLALYYTGIYWMCSSLIFFKWDNYDNIDEYFVKDHITLPFE